VLWSAFQTVVERVSVLVARKDAYWVATSAVVTVFVTVDLTVVEEVVWSVAHLVFSSAELRAVTSVATWGGKSAVLKAAYLVE